MKVSPISVETVEYIRSLVIITSGGMEAHNADMWLQGVLAKAQKREQKEYNKKMKKENKALEKKING